MGKKKRKYEKNKAEKTDNNAIDELKEKIKHQKDALTKIIKSYTHEK